MYTTQVKPSHRPRPSRTCQPGRNSSRSYGELNLEAEDLKAFDETLGGAVLVDAIKGVWAEVAIVHAVTNDVVGRFAPASPTPQRGRAHAPAVRPAAPLEGNAG